MSKELINRQYVGARYVPKIIGEWDKAISYEALSVVTYKGNSFTSKIPVPAKIDISNENYWVNTGAYNAQVEEYRKITESYVEKTNKLDTDLKNLDNKVDHLNDRFYIFLGDSYMQGYNPDGSPFSPTFMDYIIEYTGISNYTKASAGGCGFANSNNDFTSLLKTIKLPSGITNTDVTDIILLAGYNDYSWSANAIETGMDNFKNYYLATYPNAKLKIGYIGWDTHANTFTPRMTSIRCYAELASKIKGSYLSGLEYVLHNKSDMCSDGKHPNANGHLLLGRYCASALINGSVTPKSDDYNTHIVAEVGWEASPSIITNRVGQIVTIIMDSHIYKHEPFQMKCNGTNYPLFKLSDGFVIGNANELTRTTVPVVLHCTDKTYNFKSVNAEFIINDGTVSIMAHTVGEDSTGGNFWVGGVDNINVPRITLTMNALNN